MSGSVKSKIILITILLLVMAVLVKLFTPFLLKGLLISKTQNFIKHNYSSEIKVDIKKVNVKVIDLLLLKPTLIIKELQIGDRAICERIEAELNILELIVKNNLIFKFLKVEYAEILLATDFNLRGIKGKNSKQVFIHNAEFKNIDLIITNPRLPKKRFELRKVNLNFNDFSIPQNKDTEETFFKLSSDLKNYQKTGLLKLSGKVTEISGEETNVFEINGQVMNLDLQSFLSVAQGQKQALAGNLSTNNLDLVFDSKNINLNADIKIQSANSFLVESMKKAQRTNTKEFNLNKILSESTKKGVSIPDSQYYRVGISNYTPGQIDAKLQAEGKELYLKEIRVSTPYLQESQEELIKQIKKKKKKSFFKKLKSLF